MGIILKNTDYVFCAYYYNKVAWILLTILSRDNDNYCQSVVPSIEPKPSNGLFKMCVYISLSSISLVMTCNWPACYCYILAVALGTIDAL